MFMWQTGEWQISFRRSFSNGDMSLWEDLLDLLDNISLSDEEDRISWELLKSKEFTTKSLPFADSWGVCVCVIFLAWTFSVDFWGCWLYDKCNVPNHLCIFVFAGLTWALWNSRNKRAAEVDGAVERGSRKDASCHQQHAVSQFKTRNILQSDIGEIWSACNSIECYLSNSSFAHWFPSFQIHGFKNIYKQR